jgi:hypothetical protein
MSSQPHVERRPRAEIDRNYFLGDVFIRTGVAVGLVILVIAALTPFSLRQAVETGMFGYITVMTAFGAIGLAAYLFGRHLRRNATHWDRD